MYAHFTTYWWLDLTVVFRLFEATTIQNGRIESRKK